MSFTLDFSDPPARRCGACQLCCKLLPVQAIHKPGGVACRHQRVGKGCLVYARMAMPAECRLWSCRWLVDPETAALGRPDRTHYVIDIMPDRIRVDDPAAARSAWVVQVWLDPAFPTAHRDPALRRYLAAQGTGKGMAAIVRTAPGAGFLLIPPALSEDGAWHERVVIWDHGPNAGQGMAPGRHPLHASEDTTSPETRPPT